MRPLRTHTFLCNISGRSYFPAHPSRTFGFRPSTRSSITSRHRGYHHHPPHDPSRPYIRFDQLRPIRQSIDPVTILVALAIFSTGTYLISEFVYPPQPIVPPPPSSAPTPPSHDHKPAMTSIAEGHSGHLSPEHETKLKEFWQALFDIFGVQGTQKTNGVASSASETPAAATSTEATDVGKKKSRLGWLRGSKEPAATSKDTDKASIAEVAEDKHGLNKEYQRALTEMGPETIRAAFWSMTKADDPDALLLRFLRARKWVVHDAVVMLISALHWRSVEMKVDEEVMFKGDGGFLQEGSKDGQDFVTQFRKGKSSLHGVDKEGRPVNIVRAALHHAGDQTERSMEMYTVWTIETARLLLKPPIETATIIFDMTGFTLSNMDYAPVKFMIRCFEANYPESLGSVLVYRAPWIFQGIWKIIRGWLDPVVASKIHFVADEKELTQFVAHERIPKRLGGAEDWEEKYLEPVAGENKLLEDEVGRKALQDQRRQASERMEKETLRWISDGQGQDDRAKTKEELRANYWKLDPYVRARGLYDRLGVIKPGGELDHYPLAAAAPVGSAVAANGEKSDDADGVD